MSTTFVLNSFLIPHICKIKPRCFKFVHLAYTTQTSDIYVGTTRPTSMQPSQANYRPISFYKGYPDQTCLAQCASMLKNASFNIAKDEQSGLSATFYGSLAGCAEFRTHLADFLSKEYGSHVNSENLFLTCGSTIGLHFIASMLFHQSHPFFVEEPSYTFCLNTLSNDLPNKVTAISLEYDGINIETLEKQITLQCTDVIVSKRYPWKALLYIIPVHHNPTGIIYTKEKCMKLIEIAQKHDVLIVCDDVYNLLTYDQTPPPPRLFACETPISTTGHVISIGSFTKYFSPGLRLGWLEARTGVIQFFVNTGLLRSGGSLNHYLSTLVANIIKNGDLTAHLNNLKTVYKEKMHAMIAVLSEHLPKSCQCSYPKGGYFIWITLPEHLSADEFNTFAQEKYGLTIYPGNRCSLTGACRNNLRVCFVERSLEDIKEGTKRLCEAIETYVLSNQSSNNTQ